MAAKGPNATVGGKPISALLDGDDDGRVLGYCVMVTTGDHLYVPRDWLDEQFEKHGLNRTYFPGKPREWMAYGRMINILLDRQKEETLLVNGEPHRVKYDLLEGEDTHKHHLIAKVFWEEDQIGVEGGEWRNVTLGHFDFSTEDAQMFWEQKVEEDTMLAKRWNNRFLARAKGLYEKLQTHHNGNDMRDVVKDWLADANTVSYRQGAYFVPATQEEPLMARSDIWRDMNQFKERGETTNITTIPVVSTEDQQQEVERRARAMLDGMVGDIVDAALTRLEEAEDETAQKAAESFVDQISEAESFAAEYNQILDARMSIRDALEDQFDELEDEKEELVEAVLDQTEVS